MAKNRVEEYLQAVVRGAHAGRIERGRELVNSAYTVDSGQITLYYLQQMM